MPHILNTREITKDYNEIHLFEDDEKKTAKLEMWIAKRLGGRLVDAYPNRQWGVEVDIPGQMVIVTCPSLSLEKGYHIAMFERTIMDLEQRAIMGAGEILERFGISRNRKFDHSVIDSMDEYITGEKISGHSSQEGEDPIKK